jgi:hypothetical protein
MRTGSRKAQDVSRETNGRRSITRNKSTKCGASTEEEMPEFATKEQEEAYLMQHYNNNVPMTMVREFSGTKRM